MRKEIIATILSITAWGISAQDVHFSQFTAAPLQLNPAFAGLNNCDYRVVANARTQWNTVSGGNTFSSFAVSGDVAVGKPTKFNSYAGLGLSLNADVAGALRYNTNRADLTFAYHFLLDRKGASSLSVGIQAAVNYRGINLSKGTFDQQFDNVMGVYNPNLPSNEALIQRTNMLYFDAGVGVLYSANFRQDRHNIYIGLSANHLNQPNVSFESNGLVNMKGNTTSLGQKLYLKTILHGGGTFLLKDKLWLMPMAMFAFQGTSQEYHIGSLVKIQLGNKVLEKTYFLIGAQYRGLFTGKDPVDAVVLQTRLDLKGLAIGFSYDINVSKLKTATSTFGGPELSVTYQGCLSRRPRPFFCPTL